MRTLRAVCVYCGGNRGIDPQFADAAAAFGSALAARGLDLIYGGGGIGLMGVVADAAIAGGARVIGVMPRQLIAREQGHRGAGVELRVVDSMHERKSQMAALADAFVALAGGFGTLEELFETITWAQLGIHDKPCAVLNTGGYYDPLVTLLDQAVVAGFVRPEYRGLVFAESDPGRLLDRLATHALPITKPWLAADES